MSKKLHERLKPLWSHAAPSGAAGWRVVLSDTVLELLAERDTVKRDEIVAKLKDLAASLADDSVVRFAALEAIRRLRDPRRARS